MVDFQEQRRRRADELIRPEEKYPLRPRHRNARERNVVPLTIEIGKLKLVQATHSTFEGPRQDQQRRGDALNHA